MRSLIVTLFGTYTPVEGVVGIDVAGEPVYGVVSGMAGVDWPFLAGVLLFAVLLYGFTRLLGVLLK